MSLGSEISEPKGSENSEPKSTPKSKEQPLVYSTLVVPALVTSEISTAEDCRLEISLEMKAEQELRRLAFTSRQRFLTGMDLKSGLEIPGIAAAPFGSSGMENVCIESSEAENSEASSSVGGGSGIGSSGVGSSGVGSSGVGSSRAVRSEVECSGVEIAEIEIDKTDDKEENDEDSRNTYYFVSECMGRLIVDAFNGHYEVESVLELCLLLNSENSPSFLVTQQAMEASLGGLSTIEGASARYLNLTICWLRMLLRQTQHVTAIQGSGRSNTCYVTATSLVENPRFPRVFGKMLTTRDLGESGQNVLGPTVVKNLKLLLKELLAMTSVEHQRITTSTFQEVLLDTLLYMTVLR